MDLKPERMAIVYQERSVRSRNTNTYSIIPPPEFVLTRNTR